MGVIQNWLMGARHYNEFNTDAVVIAVHVSIMSKLKLSQAGSSRECIYSSYGSEKEQRFYQSGIIFRK